MEDVEKFEDENTTIIEDINIISSIFEGRTLDIIIELMDNELTEEQLISRLDIYPLKLKYYLSKLEKYNIVECVKVDIIKEKMKNMYKLKTKNIDFLINKSNESKLKLQPIASFNNYKNILKKGLITLSQYPELTNKQGAIFIHTSDEKIKKFKQALNMLIQEFINSEEEDGKNGFLFMPMLFPYEVEADNDDKVVEE